jgi:hypothetical protein
MKQGAFAASERLCRGASGQSAVIPEKSGIQRALSGLGSRLRGSDVLGRASRLTCAGYFGASGKLAYAGVHRFIAHSPRLRHG